MAIWEVVLTLFLRRGSLIVPLTLFSSISFGSCEIPSISVWLWWWWWWWSIYLNFLLLNHKSIILLCRPSCFLLHAYMHTCMRIIYWILNWVSLFKSTNYLSYQNSFTIYIYRKENEYSIEWTFEVNTTVFLFSNFVSINKH